MPQHNAFEGVHAFNIAHMGPQAERLPVWGTQAAHFGGPSECYAYPQSEGRHGSPMSPCAAACNVTL